MASLLSFSLFSLFLFLSLSSSSTTTLKTNRHHPAKQKQKPRPNVPPSSASTTPPEILQACKATRFQDTCVSSLSNPNVPRNPTPLQIIQSAISVSNTNLKTAQSMVKSILDSSTGNINRTTAAKNCVEALINSQYRITRSTDDALPRGRVKDARAWMGAALLYQYDCSNALKYANDTSLTRQTMSFLDTLMAFSSNALSMIVSYDAFGNDTKSWGPPKTERDGVWELGSAPGSGGDFGSGFRGGFPSELTADVTVCKDMSNGGCYKTVQEAVNTAPDNEWGHRYVIHIKEGVYNEIVRVPLEKKNVVFLGDGMGKTVITGSLAVGQPGISTYNTATVDSSTLQEQKLLNHHTTIMAEPSSPTGSTKPLNNFGHRPPFSSSKSKCFVLIIAIVLLLSLVSLILFLTLSSKTNKEHRYSPQTQLFPSIPAPITTRQTQTDIHLACNATQHPQTCESSLREANVVPPNPTPLQVIQSAIFVSSQNLTTAKSILNSLLASTTNPNITTAAKICLEVLGYSQYRISSANQSLTRGEIKNARAWMSAGLSYQNDCYGGLIYNAGNSTSKPVNETLLFLESLVGLTSNALSMTVSYDLFGNETESWRPPQTERDGFWEDSVLDGVRGFFRGGFPSKLTADATVCKDESKDNGCYKTVQEAVNAAPDNAMDRRFVIHIKEGVYEEIVRVPFEKKNVVFLGDGMGKSVITGSLSVGQIGVTTYESATVGVLGDGFMASGLTIQNTAGAPTHQAVAFRSDSDLSIIENCEFLGNQDTLYAHSLRQFYKSCHIEGNVDFIFGNSAAIFQDCQILIRPRQEKPEKGENNAVTAHGRTDPAQSTGFVFQNCLINGTEEYMALYRSKPSVHKNFLGRPWKEFSRTVFIHCNLEALLSPQGWMPWSGDFALKTLYYGEFENSGPGSDSSQRVTWSSQIPAEHVATYSVQNFIQGDEWIPTSS